MTNELAKNIITEYVFSDYNILVVYKFLNKEILDQLKESEKKYILKHYLQKLCKRQ